MTTSSRKILPHVPRAVTKRHPYHVVLSLAHGAPAAHRRRVRETFKYWIAVTSERYSMPFNLGTWMVDHVHLVVETPRDEGDLSNALRFLCSKVAIEINKAFGRQGALFRDRFFSRILATTSDLINTLKYVAFNPVKAKHCSRPEHWFAGGTRDYLLGEALPGPWKKTDSGSLAGGPTGQNPHVGGDSARSLWSFHGHQFHQLGFFKNPRTALKNILSNVTRPRAPSKGRQLRLPFKRGLPRQPR